MTQFLLTLALPPICFHLLKRVAFLRVGIPLLWVGYWSSLMLFFAVISAAFVYSSDPLPDVPYLNIFSEVATKNNLDPLLLIALVDQESRFNPMAVSPAGAMGLGQLMPATAASLGVSDPFNPVANLNGAGLYLAQMMDRYDSIPLALAAYNAGPGRVDSCLCVPAISETQTYVRNVLANYAKYSGVTLPYRDEYQLFNNGYHGDYPRGRDYVSGCHTPLYTPLADGVVTRKGTDGLGNSYLVIARGKIEIILLHGDYVAQIGDVLRAGELIGYEDTRGNSDRCHTHYSLIVAETEIDPVLAGLK